MAERRKGRTWPFPAMIAGALALALLAAAPASANRIPFGFNDEYIGDSDGARPEEKMELTAAAGAKLARTSLNWRCVEVRRDVWEEDCWSRYGLFYQRALAHDVRPLFILITSPRWASAHRCRRRFSSNCAVPPARRHDKEWREFAAEAAARFPRAVFEIWNEPNITAFWNGKPQPARYAELVRIAYRAINGASRRATVLAGAVVGTNVTNEKIMGSERFLRRAVKSRRGLARSLDGLSFHMYGLSQGLGRGSYFETTTDRMRAIARRYLPKKGRRLWVTETGTSTRFPESLTAREQKRRLWRVWRLLGQARGVRGVIFHRLIQPKETSDSKWQYGLAWTRYRPLSEYPRPIKPKPVFCRFSRRLGPGYAPCRR